MLLLTTDALPLSYAGILHKTAIGIEPMPSVESTAEYKSLQPTLNSAMPRGLHGYGCNPAISQLAAEIKKNKL